MMKKNYLTEDLKLYHKDVYFRPAFYTICDTMLKERIIQFTLHCYNRCKDKNINDILVLHIINEIKNKKCSYELFEVKNGNRYIEEFAIRTKYVTDKDICIVFKNKYDKEYNLSYLIIKTLWINNHSDLHYTLDKTKYETK